jgi:hypothetical protein
MQSLPGVSALTWCDYLVRHPWGRHMDTIARNWEAPDSLWVRKAVVFHHGARVGLSCHNDIGP